MQAIHICYALCEQYLLLKREMVHIHVCADISEAGFPRDWLVQIIYINIDNQVNLSEIYLST